MKRLILLVLAGLAAALAAQADIIYVQGDVSGTWAADTVMVTGEVRVPPGQTLVIEPGVKVLFQVYCKFIVDNAATLLAVGTEVDSITFDAMLPGDHWQGIRFISSSNDAMLKYCLLGNGLANPDSAYPENCGGGIYISNCSPLISKCTITRCIAINGGAIGVDDNANPMILQNMILQNGAEARGGGIDIHEASALIMGNTFAENRAYLGGGMSFYLSDDISILNNCFMANLAQYGGAIESEWSNYYTISTNLFMADSAYIGGAVHSGVDEYPIFRQNIVSRSYSTYGAGIYLDWGADGIITENIIIDNVALNHGGGLEYGYYDNPIIYHNSIFGNAARMGGGISCEPYSVGLIYGNTISANNARAVGGGIYAWYMSTPQIMNCIIWDNQVQEIGGFGNPDITYSDVEDTWPGLGNVNLYPAFVDTAYDDYRLLWGSPCIDSGDPNPIYNDPDGTRADMGAFYYDQSVMVRILLTPHEIPYLIPEIGGSMDYTIRAFNRDSLAHATTVWCNVTLPDSSVYGPVLGPVTITLGAGALLERVRTQNVPAIAPMGVYHYNAYAVVGSDTSKDSFMWGKLGARGWGLGTGDWMNAGEPITDVGARRAVPAASEGEARLAPTRYALHPCSPNPFNARTAISYQLSANSFVSLRVYNITGKLVATLVDGWREAGTHELTFDAGELPSGMYFARLEAGGYLGVQKMALLK